MVRTESAVDAEVRHYGVRGEGPRPASSEMLDLKFPKVPRVRFGND